MKPYSNSNRWTMAAALAGVLLAPSPALHGQADDALGGEVFELSPFEVSTSGDRGYYAANAITGSRISVPIQEMPLTIEVVTSEFISDTGATNLRDSLRYSAGILLQTQNDAYGSFSNVGNVNNPEGATADKGESSFKIRGFVLDNTLRNGFRRRHATDTVNIDRIEVIRGPSALLYGVGNFGGVVNYITKTPLPEPRQEVNLGYGSYNFYRASLDSTGSLFSEQLAYRLTMAYESRENHTELFSHEHFFISPVVQWKPFRRVKITFDGEFGKADDDAISFLSVRAPTLEGIPVFQTDRLETYGFLEFPGKDVRRFRWSGPDTYLDTFARNGAITADIGITENLYYRGGMNISRVKFNLLDVFGGISTNSTSPRAQPFLNTIRARQIIDGAANDVIIEVPRAVLQYNWYGSDEVTDWTQYRQELNYNRRVLQGRRWLESEHNVLLGYSHEKQKFNQIGSGTADSPDGDNWMYKDPTDSSYIRFGRQSDGTPDLNFRPTVLSGSVATNDGKYVVYSGRYFKDRLFLVAGMREDRTTSRDGYFENIGSRAGRQFFPDSIITKRSKQFGVSFEVLSGVSVFALNSEGVEPNFGGKRDGLGRALDATVADATEFGVKVNLLEGRIAGTLSTFKIRRDGLPFSYWWAPAPIRGQFRREDPIIYRMDEWNPVARPNNRYLQAGREQWNAAVAAGAVYDKKSADGRFTFKYLNASTPEGAAFLDAVFDALKAEFALPRDQRTDNDPWPGWLYNGFDDPEVNTAAEDWSSGDFFQTISDESRGWEAQVVWSPTENLQLILNYSHVKREVVSPGNFVKYDYAEGNWDRWAVWYFPNANWGLGGVPTELVYPGGPAPGLPNPDTSTWTGVGWGKGEALDDTPAHVVSWWANYKFPEETRFAGFELGFGGQWESKREYASAFTTAGQRKQNQNEEGVAIKAFTDPRLTLNAMAKYSWRARDRYDAFLQLNVDNLLDDKKQYGFIYAPGISWRLNLGVSF